MLVKLDKKEKVKKERDLHKRVKRKEEVKVDAGTLAPKEKKKDKRPSHKYR